jgi:hypothetical protein
MGMWTCQTCKKSFGMPIYMFPKTCPKCGEKYKYLGSISGLHVAHSLPLYCRERDWPDNVKLGSVAPAAFARSGKKRITIRCPDVETARFMRKHYKGRRDIDVTISYDRNAGARSINALHLNVWKIRDALFAPELLPDRERFRIYAGLAGIAFAAVVVFLYVLVRLGLV